MNWGDPRLNQRFWDKVVPEPNSGCWLWVGAASPGDYGRLTLNWKQTSPHRVAYSAFVGPIPLKYDIDHLCRTPACCNPSHLEAVTRSVNLSRGIGGLPLARRNLAKTHCPAGHPYFGENLSIKRGYHRSCKACARAYYHRKKYAETNAA